MSCTEKTFEVEVPEGESAEALLKRAQDAARAAGIALVGDARGGSFRGTAEGSYVVSGRLIRVTVTRKPGFVPWGVIEGSLRKVFR